MMDAVAPGVLIVDDEPGVRQVLELVCVRSGMRPFATGSGQEAVALYERHRGEIQLVLLDVNMPAIDGPATLARLRQVAPDVRVCFMSGATGRYTVEGLLAMGAERFFEKPFRFDRLGPELFALASAGRAAA
jgi:two-component system cell cycle sensor histidine kinase/response regulator CckA